MPRPIDIESYEPKPVGLAPIFVVFYEILQVMIKCALGHDYSEYMGQKINGCLNAAVNLISE